MGGSADVDFGNLLFEGESKQHLHNSRTGGCLHPAKGMWGGGRSCSLTA